MGKMVFFSTEVKAEDLISNLKRPYIREAWESVSGYTVFLHAGNDQSTSCLAMTPVNTMDAGMESKIKAA